MLWTKLIKRTLAVAVFLFLLHTLQLPAQQNTNNLYLQTSEVADIMIQYDADKGSVMRFYGAQRFQEGGVGRRQTGEYNSPERRQRLLQLINAYQKKME